MRHFYRISCCLLLTLLFSSTHATAQPDRSNTQEKPPANNPQVDNGYAYQGEYAGLLDLEGAPAQYGVQVIATGNGTFKAVLYKGGLPGAGWDLSDRYQWTAPGKFEAQGSIDPLTGRKGLVQFQGDKHGDVVVQDGIFTVMNRQGRIAGKLKKVNRTSKTLGAKAGPKAVVLFDGKTADGWKNGRITDDGLLMQGTTSEQTFDDFKLHIEFRLPYMPEKSGQGRGNSGIYIQGRWEVQMLDSFGLTGEQNECGGIYSVGKPDVNMCLPPLTWQTYDIEFTAAKYDNDNQLKTNARMTVWHNGVKIHDNIELPNRKTTAAPVNVGPEPGPIFLQDHGNPVRYRNIWLMKKKS